MPVITLPSGRTYSAEDDETLLAAAARHEVLLPYSCRTGRCSTCKARAPAGSTRALHDELGLSAAERDAGWILTCVRCASADVSLSIEDLTGLDLTPPEMHPCRIQTMTLLSQQVMKIELRLPPASRFSYRPGQYIDISSPGVGRRSYSIANSATPDRLIELHVKRVAGGAMSRYWFDQARPNDLMRFNGPLGTFFVRELAGLDLVFLATGTGMAPVKAILEGLTSVAEALAPRSVTVYWGARTAADFYLDGTAAPFGGRLVPVLSRPDSTWAGARGYVQRTLLERAPELARTVVYACGSDEMIHDARNMLIAAGLPERRFYSDAFVCSAET